MNSKFKKTSCAVLRIVCIPFMLIGITVWGAVMFAKVGMETLAKQRKVPAK